MFRVVLSIGLSSFLSVAAPAQSTVRQNDIQMCPQAELALRNRPQGKEYRNVIGALMRCPEAGPRAFATQWRRPPDDSSAIQLLADASARFRDRRVFEAASSALLNPSNSRTVRLAAIRALIAQFDQKLDVAYRTPPTLGIGGRGYVMLGELDHPSGQDGAEPLGPSARTDVVELLKRVGSGNADNVVRDVSRYLAERLASLNREP